LSCSPAHRRSDDSEARPPRAVSPSRSCRESIVLRSNHRGAAFVIERPSWPLPSHRLENRSMNKSAFLFAGLSLAFAFPLLSAREARAADGVAPIVQAPAQPQPAQDVTAIHDEASSFKHVTITANPLSFILTRFGANLEYLPTEHHALVVNPYFQSYTVSDGINGVSASTSYTTIGGEVGYHYYTGSKGANGFFVGPSLVLNHVGVSTKANNATASSSIMSYGAALDIGAQHIFDNGFTIGAGAGVMYLLSSNDAPQSSASFKVNGVLPRVLFTLGYSF
jgi:hypothetical protein